MSFVTILFWSDTWLLLKNAINEILTKNATDLNFNVFQELYRNAYNLVKHKYGDILYSGLNQVVDEHLKGVAAQVACANDDDSFLQSLNDAWLDHQQAMRTIRQILAYLDRVYVPQTTGCLAVCELGLTLFKDNVTTHPEIGPRFLAVQLESIRKEQCGEVVTNRNLIQDTTQIMLVDLSAM